MINAPNFFAQRGKPTPFMGLCGRQSTSCENQLFRLCRAQKSCYALSTTGAWNNAQRGLREAYLGDRMSCVAWI